MTFTKHGLITAAALIGAASFSGVFVTEADAHAHMKGASPAPNSVASTPPETIRIEFNEKIEASVSAIEIVGSGGIVGANGKATTESSAPNALIVKPAQPLASGVYEVRWRAVGVDGHPMKGAYKFEVRP
ncbi:methionine-rich copper-binding protein CopC [Rhodoblastus acidophilus]|uniref:copper homeostasis periplasmic binding protein CopC n=1 Tax=Rhodoblastus acidophilus TaxID=1074 RepID=UPI002224E5D9|nr:copper homeostasis periplasmic binding protein CopC [Rhodoblastus acidophilus]MCW2319152.1 methionine-rich copper-binding protein CopC [Rhodoblastus acidophilus]